MASGMERRDKLFLLLVLGGGAYAVHTNWETIRDKLGLDDLAPGRIKAMELAKKNYNFERSIPNWQVVANLEANKEIEVDGDPWAAERIENDQWRVTCTYWQRGRQVQHLFRVNVNTGAVAWMGEQDLDRPPKPR